MPISRSLRRLVGAGSLAVTATVTLLAGATAPAQAAPLPPIGSVVCHDSPVTGWRCGVLNQINATIVFPGGVITGAFRYGACGVPGDQGAPIYHNRTQIGTVLGGSGCQTYGLPLD